MAKPLVVRIPHELSRGEARARIGNGMDGVRRQIAPFVTAIEESWTGDRMSFRVTALGQDVSGRIEVMDDVVEVEVELPWMLRRLGEMLRKRIGKEGTLMLEKK
ncbi:MAG: polyhydroxyalkanoic acid system family protein [Rhodospirillales bacterium]|nr:polyhydroxyalkanoic acid system family protein [Rhodospirillales bacterium]